MLNKITIRYWAPDRADAQNGYVVAATCENLQSGPGRAGLRTYRAVSPPALVEGSPEHPAVLIECHRVDSGHQAHGSMTGSQWAAFALSLKQQHEALFNPAKRIAPEEAAASFLARPWMAAAFQPQAWVDDNAVDVDGVFDFDALPALIGMAPDAAAKELRNARNYSIADDSLAGADPRAAEHHGPFSVRTNRFQGSIGQLDCFARILHGFDSIESPEQWERVKQTLINFGVMTPAAQGRGDLVVVSRRAIEKLWDFSSRMVAKHGVDGDDTMTDEEHALFQDGGACANVALSRLADPAGEVCAVAGVDRPRSRA